MPEPKAQLIDPQGPIDVPGLSVTGVTTATGGFVGQVQGAATGLASTTTNLSVGIITATKFQGNTTGNVSGLADDTNINVGIITSTSFTGDLVGNAAGLSTTTANIKAGILSATSFAGNFTGVASGITGTPNIVVGIMTGTLKGDGSSLTGIAATNWIANNVTANSSTTAIDLALGNVVKFTQSASTTVSFANTGTSNIVTFIRTKDDTSTARTITWPSAVKWNGGSAPTLNSDLYENDANVITLLTRDEGVTWYGWENISTPGGYQLWAWGGGATGALAQITNSDTQYSSPIQIPGDWRSICQASSPGMTSIYATKVDGTLWGWGANSQGQLGQNSINTPGNTGLSSPVQIPGTTWTKVVSGSTSSDSTLLATKTDGTLWMNGYNHKGQLGQNNRTDYSSPVQVPGTTWPTSGEEKVRSVIGPGAIKTDGTLWMWGYNANGQLGQNNRTDYSSPVQVPGTTWANIGPQGAIKTDGTLWMWGANYYGSLGLNEGPGGPGWHQNVKFKSSPVQIPGTTWSKISGSGNNNTAIKTDGTLWVWGTNSMGQLGQNSTNNGYSSPVQVPGTTWSNVSFGLNGILAFKTDNTLWAWGQNEYGAFGLNNLTQYSSPVQIPGTTWVNNNDYSFVAGQWNAFVLKSS